MVFFPNQDEYPNNCTVYIQVQWDDGGFTRGSGAMVGRNDILTASHVVYNPERTAVDIDIYPAYDGAEGPWGSFTSGQWQANYYEVGNADNTISKSDAAWDVAVIGISDPLGDSTGWYGMRSHEGSGTYTVMGYPSEMGTALTADVGHADFDNLDSFSWLTGSDTGVYDISDIYHNFGSSGGPILNANNEVCGVVSSTSWGARLDDEWGTVLDWMSSNDVLIA
jgi:V8-like Glu-specific endopeptidase